MFKLFIQRLRFSLKNLFAKKIIIPSEFKTFKYNVPKYHELLVSYLSSNSQNEINYSRKIFGKETDKLVNSKDIFSGIDFKAHDKFIPAYFNNGDVKVPYEGSRLQFLQKLDLLSMLEIKHDFQEIIDVNEFPLIYWNSPMDVAIRNINLIFHRNFLEKNDLDSKILGNNKDLIDTFISQHYQFIIENLENNGNVVGNHYLIELCSIILTLATYKFEGCEEDIVYFLNELDRELKKQFNQDGTNFEGSTHYSAFVTEALIIFKLSLEEIQPDLESLKLIEEIIFSNRNLLNLLIVNGELSQIGDNDSGRLFYFYHDEDNPLKIDWLIRLIDHFYNFENKNIINEFNFKMDGIDLEKFSRVDHPVIKIFKNNFNLYTFPDFGIYIWRNDEGSEYFSIRCGQLGQNGVGGHSHYDQLAIECFTDGKWIARDPGTGTYTDDIETRNNFRSLEFHWGPNTNIKFPKESEFDCFRLNHIEGGKLIFLDKNNFIGNAIFNGNKIYRKITIENGNIQISDFSNDTNLKAYESWGEQNGGIKYKFSRGYKRIN